MRQQTIWNLRSSARSIRETERICDSESDRTKELCRTMTYGTKIPWDSAIPGRIENP